MIERIKELIDYLKNSRKILSQAEFAQTIGIKPSQISEMLNGKRTISERTINIITESFPDINKEWLMTGQGDMLRANENCVQQNFEIPLLPVSAHGGTLNDFVAAVRSIDCEKIISPICNADFAITVAGDSMSPEYPSGSQILIKKINERAFIDWGKVYVLDTCNGSVIKKILPTDNFDQNKVKCVSINPEYPPFEVSLSDVYGVYKVMLCMSIK